MSQQQDQQQRLREVSRLVGTLTEQMMTAYAVGAYPPETQVVAFCRGVLLLEENAVVLPRFAEEVIGRLQACEDAVRVPQPTRSPTKPKEPRSILHRLLRPLWVGQVA